MTNKKDTMQFSWFDLAKSVVFLLDKHKKKYFFCISCLLILFFYNLFPPILLGEIVDFFTTFKEGDSLNVFYILTALL